VISRETTAAVLNIKIRQQIYSSGIPAAAYQLLERKKKKKHLAII